MRTIDTLPLVTVAPRGMSNLPSGIDPAAHFRMLKVPGRSDVLLVLHEDDPAAAGFWPAAENELLADLGYDLSHAKCWWINADYIVDPALAAALARAEKAEALAQRRYAEHEADIALIGARLIDEANDREWCEVFDEAVADLNRRLNIELPVRSREVEYEVSGYLRVPFSTTVTVTVSPGDDVTDLIENELNASDAFDDADRYDAEVLYDELEVTER